MVDARIKKESHQVIHHSDGNQQHKGARPQSAVLTKAKSRSKRNKPAGRRTKNPAKYNS